MAALERTKGRLQGPFIEKTAGLQSDKYVHLRCSEEFNYFQGMFERSKITVDPQETSGGFYFDVLGINGDKHKK